MKTTKHNVGALARRGLFNPDTFNKKNNSVEVVFSSEEPAMMWNWDIGSFKEILSHDPEHVRLGRMQKGVSVLDNHKAYGSVRDSILGRASSPKLEKGQGICLINLSDREDNKGLVNDVEKGFIADISVGYRVYKYKI